MDFQKAREANSIHVLLRRLANKKRAEEERTKSMIRQFAHKQGVTGPSHEVK